ncbi:L,D-transpeptidase family protein [Thiolapillus sp.]
MSLHLQVELAPQRLHIMDGGKRLASYPVSTAANGPGASYGSECTPLGLHRIRLKIGENCPLNTVFVGRRPTGEIYTPELGLQYPHRDWVLTRILWLTGMEAGKNRSGDCDTLKRFIYIHGTPEESLLGQPVSHGCIRMNNADMIEVFDRVSNGSIVSIQE